MEQANIFHVFLDKFSVERVNLASSIHGFPIKGILLMPAMSCHSWPWYPLSHLAKWESQIGAQGQLLWVINSNRANTYKNPNASF